ncbi:hypothetical protein [Thiohalobacter sp.]|uniref:hypothetical protein n=1 Tax=Thiohalobacter sp. TaxID=2025948 RepID=UPI002633FB48|nr:hypothetical protein [Thiohalobacter sp.]
MQETHDINIIAWWGALLSTFLALVKLWELWNDRFRIDIGYNFTGAPDIGNEIFVRNLSSKPIILSYWELLYGSGKWPFRKLEEIESPGPDACDIRIDPHSSKTFTFAEENYFDWGLKTLKGRKIYMRLYVAGRRPVVKKLYG